MSRCLIGEWRDGDSVNLEPALTLRTPLGGHLVAGHVDCVGRLRARVGEENCARMHFTADRDFGKLIAAKGALAIDGVGLTVNTVTDHADHTAFEIMLVPHTLAATTLGQLATDARVHLEADPVARYVQRLIESREN